MLQRAIALAALVLALPAAAARDDERRNDERERPFPSTYEALPSTPVLLRGATVFDGAGRRYDKADVLLRDGKVEAIGESLDVGDATVVDANGRFVTPGLIDVHSHLGVYPSPGVTAHQDGNEMTEPVTAGVWAEHAIWPQDPGFAAALAGGVTSMQILPGSGNLIGGRGVTVKNVPATSYQGMKFPGAPHGLKMACGENPKRYYGAMKRSPMTRMGNVAGYRQAFSDAAEYQRGWDKHRRERAAWANKREKDRGEQPQAPKRDLKMETLAGALSGDVLVHIHCYRADEMEVMLDLADEFGFKIAAFHHGVEAYKVADRLAEEGVCGALWADWWGFKMEAWDGIQENIAIVDRPKNGCSIVHSDSSEGIQRLNQEAAKAMVRGERVGMSIPPERAMTWLTLNAAKSLGIADRTGSLEPGKMADVVVWNRDPFSVYARPDLVYVDGALVYDRNDPNRQPVSDFLLGEGVVP